MRPQQKVETFSDGIVSIYAENGRKIGKLKGNLRFEQQSVGINRFYSAQDSVAGNSIDRVIKVPHTNMADRMDIAVIASGKETLQYRIKRIQEKPERGVDLWELQSVQVSIRMEENSES